MTRSVVYAAYAALTLSLTACSQASSNVPSQPCETANISSPAQAAIKMQSARNVTLQIGPDCAPIAVTLFPTALAGAGKSYAELSPFSPKYAPTYVFEGLSDEALAQIFSEPALSTSGGAHILQSPVNGMEYDTKHRPEDMIWEGQSQRITDHMSTLRVTETFELLLPSFQRVTDSSGKTIGFLAHGENFISSSARAVFFKALSDDVTVAVPLTITDEKYRAFESAYDAKADRSANEKLRNDLLRPTHSIDAIIAAIEASQAQL